MNSLTDDARGEHCRSDAARFVTHDATIRGGDNAFAAVAVSFRESREDALRRQPLLDIKARNNRSKLIVECDSQQTAANRRAPDLLRMIAGRVDDDAARVNARNNLS